MRRAAGNRFVLARHATGKRPFRYRPCWYRDRDVAGKGLEVKVNVVGERGCLLLDIARCVRRCVIEGVC